LNSGTSLTTNQQIVSTITRFRLKEPGKSKKLKRKKNTFVISRKNSAENQDE